MRREGGREGGRKEGTKNMREVEKEKNSLVTILFL